MNRILAQSPQATRALQLVSSLQNRFVTQLETLAKTLASSQRFTKVEWLRDEGKHGGGIRFETADGNLIGRGSVNVSQVHYDDMAEKKLASANAISTIIHPCNPFAPSVHIHISWTEMKDGSGYWRMMADLNPSHEKSADTTLFLAALKDAAPKQFDEAKVQGEHYFFIPVLERHRGAAHFYLENYFTAEPEADYQLAKAVGETAIDTYVSILTASLTAQSSANPTAQQTQLAYHTLYFFQVLTLDRGTTTGLLVHDQNDVGIMGSLPAYVDRNLLQSWLKEMPQPQEKLLQALIDCLPNETIALVDSATKIKLSEAVRTHYHNFPEAIAMQASAYITPATVDNHRL
ncbi:MAG: coproporphyrinogen III oxidase [Zetaproteobacteria bacterium]|nr:coproporphyrinogen III oxidase [Zetaproteobacteria bacterium]